MRVSQTLIIFLLTTSIFVHGCFTDTPHKEDVTSSVNRLFKNHRPIFNQLIDTFQRIESHSSDWELEYFLKRGVLFYSNRPFETYGISFEEYKNRYYADRDTITSPCYVEDFKIPENFKDQIERIDVYKVRIIKNTLGTTDRVNFYFKSDKFPPITRTVILSYFPNNIPDTLKTGNDYVDELNWKHTFSKKYLLRSIEDN